MRDGAHVEVATVGREGMLGIGVFLGDRNGIGRTFQQVPNGPLPSMPAARFVKETASAGPFRDVVSVYAQANLLQIMQCTACNALHNVTQRCCRWLLQTHDRVDDDTFLLKQEFLAMMLGVHRPTVTVVLRALQREGLISSRYGRIQILHESNWKPPVRVLRRHSRPFWTTSGCNTRSRGNSCGCACSGAHSKPASGRVSTVSELLDEGRVEFTERFLVFRSSYTGTEDRFMTTTNQFRYLACALTVVAAALIAAPAGAQQPTGAQTALASDAGTLSDKFAGLARVMAGKYDWKPGQGVRSAGDVFNLIVAENKMLAAPAHRRGATRPAALRSPIRPQMQEALRSSYAALKTRAFRSVRQRSDRASRSSGWIRRSRARR